MSHDRDSQKWSDRQTLERIHLSKEPHFSVEKSNRAKKYPATRQGLREEKTKTIWMIYRKCLFIFIRPSGGIVSPFEMIPDM